MPYYFGKDKGFFAAERIEPKFVMMAPPTAIAALLAGELDFSSTTGAATSAMMRGLPLKRMFYVQQDPAHVLLSQPEIQIDSGAYRKDNRCDRADGRGRYGRKRDPQGQWHRCVPCDTNWDADHR